MCLARGRRYISVSIVLAIQALLFGDGGLTSFGANCFNMAVVLPMVGYFIYKVISGNSDVSSTRRLVGAIVGSYLGIIAASLVAGLELGIQPLLFHAADGTPLYAPYGLNVAIPAMAIGHLAIAGPVEAIVTGLIFFYLQKSHSTLLNREATQKSEGKLWFVWAGALVVLAFATPLGLLAAGTAWAEWGADELKEILGYVPQGWRVCRTSGMLRCPIILFQEQAISSDILSQPWLALSSWAFCSGCLAFG